MKKFLFIFLLFTQICCNENPAIIKDGFIFAYPMVQTEITKDIIENKVGLNKFSHSDKFPNPKDAKSKYTTRPNMDVLYSHAFLDLSKSPIILSVPDTRDRYYLMQIMDGWTNVFASIGKRTTRTKAKNFLIVGPNWKSKEDLSNNFEIIQSPTNTVSIVGRIQTDSEKEYPVVNALQKKFELKALVAEPEDKKSKKNLALSTKSPNDQIKDMGIFQFFSRFVSELPDNTVPVADRNIMERLKKIDIIPGEKYNPHVYLDEKSKQQARNEIIEQTKKIGKNVNNWQIILNSGSYGADYLSRAAASYLGIGSNLSADAIYPTAFVDESGEALSGKNKYLIHFDALPPVNGFWSITLYDEKNLLVPNSMDRYSLGTKDKGLIYNSDGSLDIYVQHNQPSRSANWIPAPKGKFNLTMRLYWPKNEALDGSWAPPVIKRVK